MVGETAAARVRFRGMMRTTMAYRDELEAAHQRAAALEREIAERDEQHRSRERALQKKIRRLELRIEQLGAGPSRLRRLASQWLAAGVIVLCYGLAFLLAAADHEDLAWLAANAGVCAAVLLPVLMAMTRAVRLRPWLLGFAVKAAVLVQWGWGWWMPTYELLPDSSTYSSSFDFFWYAPPVFLLLVVIERLLIALAGESA
jgi:hypothetical protein